MEKKEMSAKIMGLLSDKQDFFPSKCKKEKIELSILFIEKRVKKGFVYFDVFNELLI